MGCLPLGSGDVLGTVAAAAQHHDRGSHCILLAKEKINIQNPTGFYWTCITFTPL